MRLAYLQLKIWLTLALFVAVLVGGRYVFAAPNYQINYQGKLTDDTGATVADGTYNIAFNLFPSPTSGTSVWSSTTTVSVVNGLFSYMLGSDDALTGVDFNQTLYLSVNIGGTGAPSWDGEMTPRKVLGTVPAAFIAQLALDSNTVGGVASTSFLRNDQAGTTSATAAGTLLSIEQNGSGNILDLWSGSTKYFTVLGNGNVGIGTSSPARNLSIDGDMQITGGLYDNNNTRGTNGMVLQTTGSGLEWVATSSLGLTEDLTNNSITELSDVDTTGAVSGNILAFNGTNWVDFATSTFLMESELNTFSELDTLVADKSIANLNDAQTFAGLLTMTGGLISNSSSTLANLNFTTATGTTLVLGGDTITDFTGSGLTLSSGALTANISESNLNIAGSPTNGYLLQASSTATGGFAWVATSTLGISGGITGTQGYAITFNGSGSQVATSSLFFASNGNIGIGSTTPEGRLAIHQTGITGSQVAGIRESLNIANTTLNAVIYGDNSYIKLAPTATTTMVGSIIRIEDNTTLGNNVQGFQVQTNRGSNTQGENTAIAGFGRTFGVRGTTEGDAGALFEPAGVFAETRGTTQGNALRAYSNDITSADLVAFYQDSSAFSGDGLVMDFGASGSFTGNYLSLQSNGTTRFAIDSAGTIHSSSTGTSTYANGINLSSGCFAVNGTCISGGGATTLNGLSDVDTTNAVNGTLLSFNGSSWATTSTSSLNIAISDTTGTLAATRGGTGLSSITQNQLLIGGAGNTWTQVATSSLNIDAVTVDGLDSTQFLRSDTADSASGLLTFTGGLISNSSSTLANLNFTTATGTTLVLGGDTITDFTGTGLTLSGGALTVASSSLNLTYLGLSDTPSSFTANRIPFTNSGGTALTDSANLTFNDTDLGLGVSNGIAFGGTRFLFASTTNHSIAYGENAGAVLDTTALYNVAIGYQALQTATSSDNNTAIGRSALRAITTGSENTAVGANTLIAITTQQFNNAFGYRALESNTGVSNNVMGANSFRSNTGANNTSVGDSNGTSNGSGARNALLGVEIMASNVTGSDNIGLGYQALNRIVTSTGNIGIGNRALYSALSSSNSYNIGIGYRPGQALTTGSNNILLGYQTADSLTSGSNNVIIGYDVEAPSNTGSNQLNIGNLLFGTGIDGVGTSLSSGKIGVGTTSPFAKFTVAGDLMATGALYDNAYSAGTNGMVLQSDGSGFNWVATSSLGFGTGNGTVTSVDLSVPTGFTVSGNPITTSGTLALAYDTGYGAVLTASTTEWNAFYQTPSSRITAGTGLTWSGNTINLDNDFGASIDESELNITGSPTDGYVLQASSTSAGGFVWVATSTLGISGGSATFLGLSDTINSFNTDRILFTSGSAVVDSADFAFNDSSDTLTVGGLTLADGLMAFTSRATTTIANNTAYAWTLATSTTGTPFIRVDTTSGSEMVYIGNGSSDVFIGDVGAASNLVFEESSTISGQGANVITFGVAGDTFNIAPGVAFNVGTTTQNGLLTVASSTGQSLLTLQQYGSGDILNLFDGNTEVFTVLNGGNVGVGTSTPSRTFSVAGDAVITGALYDNAYSAGTNGYVLQSTGSGFNWVATSSIGDNLGNHTASQDLNINGNSVTGLASGAVGTPSLAFSSAPTTGIYYDGSAVAFTVVGTKRGLIGANGFAGTGTLSGLLKSSNGSESAPAHSFPGDTNTGMYTEIADTLGFSTGGAARLFIDSNGRVGIGTTTPSQTLTVSGSAYITGALYDNASSSGSNGYVLQSTGTGFQWVATSSLGISGGSSLFTDSGSITYLTSLTDSLAIGTSTLFTTATNTKLAVHNGRILNTLASPPKTASIEIAGTSNVTGMVTHGDYLYVGSGSTISVYSIQDLDNMTLVGSVSTAATIDTIKLQGNYLYAALDAGTSGLQIFDISRPASPVLVGSANISDEANDLVIAGKYAYVLSRGTNALESFDISNPTNPKRIDFLSTAILGLSMVQQGNYLYITSSTGSFDVLIVDISDPANLAVVSSTDFDLGVNEIVVRGNYAYVGYTSNIGVFDVSDPTSPTQAGSVALGGAYSATAMMVSGNYLYAGFPSADQVDIYDISSSTNPVLVGTTPVGNSVYSIALQGNYMFVGTADTFIDDIHVFDMGGISAPSAEIGTLFADRIESSDILAGLGRFNDGLSVTHDALIGGQLTISGISSSTLMNANTNPALSVLSGNVLFGTSTGDARLTVRSTSTNDILNLFETSGAEVFTVLESGNVGVGSSTPLHTFSVAGDIYASGRLYDNANSAGTSGMVLQSTGTGFQWVATSSLGISGGSSLFTDGGATTYLTSTSDALAIGTTSSSTAKLNVWGGGIMANNPVSPTLVGSYNTPGTSVAATVMGRYAYVADNSGGLQIIDVADVTKPTSAGSIALGAQATEVAVAGHYAYVADYTYGLRIVDVSDPSSPILVGTYDTSGNAQDVVVSGNYAYIADDGSGLQVIDVSNPTNPKLVDNYDTGAAEALTISGHYVFLADSLNDLYILDVIDPTNVRLVSTFNTSGSGYDVAVNGSYAYLANLGAGLVIVDISDISAPVEVGTYDTAGNARGIDVAGDYAYIGDHSSGLVVVNVSSSTRPTLAGTYSTFGSMRHLSVSGRYLYAGYDASGLVILDIDGSEFSSLYAGSIGADQIQVETDLSVGNSAFIGGGLNVANDAMVGGVLTITGSASSTLLSSNTNPALLVQSGYVGIGTSTPESLLSIGKTGVLGTTTAGINQYFTLANTGNGAVIYGDRSYIKNNSSATTTIVGGIIRIEDSTSFGNTVRGFEVQTHRGTTTFGENTALSGFARTFGVRGTTEGDAGGTYEPAGGFFETKGTTQGNAIRGYSASITTADLMSLFQDTSTFTGTGLLMNFGNSGGSFASTSSKFIDLQNAGTSKFTVEAQGTTTIGDGTTNNLAGLKVGYGGICVDNDGSCNPTVAGRIYSVSSATGNSDLAEMYFSSQTLEPGEVVVADGFLSVKRATTDTAPLVLGVVSTKPGLLLGSDDTSLIANQQSYPLALTGRVPVRLSTENGAIAVGDPLTLSSIPGVAMKAESGDYIVGRALEGFDGTYAYTEGYVNQFGDDIAEPNYEAENVNDDVRINDGCSFGGGGAAGEIDETCDPNTTITELADTSEEERAARRFAAEQAALQALKTQPADWAVTEAGQTVRVGQVTMFVERGFHFDNNALTVLEELTSTSTELVLGAEEDSGETLWGRLKELAQNFVGGVLKIAGLKTDKVETKELCVDDVCIDAAELKALLEASNNKGQVIQVVPAPEDETVTSGPTVTTGTTTVPTPEPEPTPEPAATSTDTSADDIDPAADPVVDGGEGASESDGGEATADSDATDPVEQTLDPESTPEPEPEPAPAETQAPEPTPEPAPEPTPATNPS